MEKPPMEWIDKLFICMEQFYGTRWTKQFNKITPEDLFKTIWQTGLQGLTYEQIKRALVYLKRAAESNYSLPPHHLEFFRYAKGTEKPHIDYGANIGRGDPEIARRAMDEIRGKLRGSPALK